MIGQSFSQGETNWKAAAAAELSIKHDILRKPDPKVYFPFSQKNGWSSFVSFGYLFMYIMICRDCVYSYEEKYLMIIQDIRGRSSAIIPKLLRCRVSKITADENI